MVTSRNAQRPEPAALCDWTWPSPPAASLPAANGPADAAPRLGFSSYLVAGRGEYVLAVDPGTLAARMGLEPGDMVLACNDRPLVDRNDWHQALAGAAAAGGRLRLKIRDGRNGNVVHRTCRLFCWAQTDPGPAGHESRHGNQKEPSG
ncbi:MAG TPA: PDZ domain-containing protein [Planctomycetaceae bacterium]|nr:PDZ domain-containing protein [Planctomycetaceae bacterium]